MNKNAEVIAQFLLNHKVSRPGTQLLHGNHAQLIMVFSICAIIILTSLLVIKLLPFVFQLYKLRKHKVDDFRLLQVVIQHNTSESSFATEQLIRNLHSLIRHSTHKKLIFFKQRKTISLEIVASKNDGIRYLIRVPHSLVSSVTRDIRSFLSGAVITEIPDYYKSNNRYFFKSVSLKFKNHFAFPLNRHNQLFLHDPMSYITNHMTKLKNDELISYHIILRPYRVNISKKVISELEQDEDRQKLMKEKLEQPLFETTIRICVMLEEKSEVKQRISGIISSLGSISSAKQELVIKGNGVFGWLVKRSSYTEKYSYAVSRARFLNIKQKPILSVEEVGTLFHFPFTQTTETEDIVKSYSKQLPAPLSLKKQVNLDITFAKNTFNNRDTLIGLTKEERARHMYIIGATGTGKSTMLLSMIEQDIKNGKGVAVVDPHGDLANTLLDIIPPDRIKDVIYFNPYDIKYPIGVNLLELTKGLDIDEGLIEKEFIAESVISLFRKVFSDAWSAHPHRIEYILRNTIHTAFTMENPTLFTIFELLNNPSTQNKVVKTLRDEDLKNFWKYEFGRAGDYQKVKMVAPVTARIGRFLFSPSARRILEQEKSTINFDDILDNKKILICNLAKGNIGEDTSEVMGIMILNKIQLAALKRARVEKENRSNFYLYVDEFQNFATPSFVQMLSEARKYGLNLIMAEQSTSQQKDRNLVDILLANTGTIVSFRSANPRDEEFLLPQFTPYVKPNEISNLPAFHFYMKRSALNPDEPFSGETMPLKVTKKKALREKIINSSRSQFAIKYVHKQSPSTKKTEVIGQAVGSRMGEESSNNLQKNNGLPVMGKV